MPIVSKVISESKSAMEDAFWLFAGAFVGNLIAGYIYKVVPQLSTYGNIGNFAVGIVGSVYMKGMVGKLFMGYAIASGLALMNEYFSPILASVKV